MAFEVFSTTEKSSLIALSNGDKTITISGGSANVAGSIIGDAPLDPTKKIYFELLLTTPNDAGCDIGIVSEDFDPTSAGFLTGSGYIAARYDREWDFAEFSPNAPIYYGVDSDADPDDVLMLAVDMPNGDIWFGVNGSWRGGGDPAAGTDPDYTGQDFTTDDWFLGAAITMGSGAESSVATLQNDPADFTYTAPTGFEAASGPPPSSTVAGSIPFTVGITGSPRISCFKIEVAIICGGARVTNIPRTRQFYRVWITGAHDGLSNLEVPASSVQCRARSGDPTYLQVVIPGMSYAAAVALRSNGQVVVEIVYKTASGTVLQAEEIARVDIEDIQTHEGGRSKSIVIEGRRTVSHSPKAVTLSQSTYRRYSYGRLAYRFAKPDPYLRPGDEVTTDQGDTFTVDSITYIISPQRSTMEISEA